MNTLVRTSAVALALLLATLPRAASAAEVEFRTPGLPDGERDRLLAASLLVAAENEGVTDPQELTAAARAEYARLIGALYAFGRFGGTVSVRLDGREAADIPPFAEVGSVERIVVRVDGGPVYTFDRATVQPLAPGTELPSEFRRGEIARTPVIETAGRSAVTRWRETGHAKARIDGQRITARHPARTLSAELSVAPGPELRFGDVIVSGQRNVRERRIRHLAYIPKGRVYDPEVVENAVARIRRTGAFSSVSATEAETPNPDGTLDILINVAEAKPRRYGVGLEYSNVEGIALSGFWMHRNFLGGAERFRVEGEWSGIDGTTGGMDYRIGASLNRPGHRAPDTDLYILGEIEQLNEPDFTSNRVSTEIGYTRIARETLTVGAGIGTRFSLIDDVFGSREYYFFTIPAFVTYDNRDDPLNPTSGIFAKGELLPLVGLAASDSALRFFGDARSYLSFGPESRKTVLAGRLMFGTVVGPELTSVPDDLRFYSGGGGTVRGQPYQSLDIDIGGRSSGGRSFLGLSAEARVPVSDAIALVGFADWGYVGENSFPDDTGGSHAGAGIGLRYNTGIGPIRLDVAKPFDGGFGKSTYIYIGIGQAF